MCLLLTGCCCFFSLVLKHMRRLKTENMKYRAENDALIRVISRLSKGSPGSSPSAYTPSSKF